MRIVSALLGSVLIASAAAANVHPATRLVDLQVIDRDSGAIAQVHRHDGQYWIAGTPGHRYAVRLVNRTGERVLAVLSVDGVNAVSGETASPQQAGYVLGPWQQTEVTGWRKSLSDVAQFEFTALPDSYAARTGRPGNVGVIGIAVFREQPVYRPHREAEIARSARMPAEPPAAADRAPAAPGAAPGKQRAIAAMPQESLGTGHGAREWSQARQVQFVRATREPAEAVSLRYGSQRNLVALGVIPSPPRRPWRDQPQAFPAGFVPDPR